MTARRPYVGIPGTTPKFKELVDTDDLIAPRLSTPGGTIWGDPNLVSLSARQRGLKQWLVKPGTNGWERFGFAVAPTTTGTLTNADTDTGAFVRITTAGGGSNHGEVRGDYTQTRLNRLPIFSVLLRTPSSLANIRIWSGLSIGQLTGDPDNDPGEHVAMRFDKATDTNWMIHSSDGGANNVADSGVVVATSTEYLLEVAIVNGVAVYLINGAYVGTITSRLPQPSSNMGPYICIDELAAGAKTLDVGLISLWTR